MFDSRQVRRIVPAVAGLLAFTAGTAAADESLFSWSGTVDREVLIVLRGRQIETRGLDARLPNNARVINAIPRSGYGDVRVVLQNGRGSADVIEQPSARNGYQTVIRVRDPQGGADRYRVMAYWTGDDRYDRNDRGRDGRNDGPWDRDGRSGRDDRNGRDDDRYGRDRDRDGRNDRDDDRNGRGNGGYGNGRDDGRDAGRGNGRYEGSGTLNWSGTVDDVVEITIRGDDVRTTTRSGAAVSDVRSRLNGGALPRTDGNVRLSGSGGRGTVQVIQQPSRSNGYTAVIRITDNRGGIGRYDFQASW